MKKLFVISMISLMLLPVVALAAELNTGIGYATNTGLGNADPRDIAAQVINILLGFLGIIAVVIILIGGFKWMTAGGNEDKVAEAKKLLAAGAIGLIIVFMAYGLAQYVLSKLVEVTTG